MSKFEIITRIDSEEVLKLIEFAGRTRDESESGEDTAQDYVANLIKKGNYYPLEHFSVSVLLEDDDRRSLGAICIARGIHFIMSTVNLSPKLYITATLKDWRYIFETYLNNPKTKDLLVPLLHAFKKDLHYVFYDINP